MRRQVETWRQAQISDDQAKLVLYKAFVEGELEAPKTLLSDVHRLYFQPEYEEFSPRTMWSLSNAFTSAFKELDPIPQFKATAKLGAFLSQLARSKGSPVRECKPPKRGGAIGETSVSRPQVLQYRASQDNAKTPRKNQ